MNRFEMIDAIYTFILESFTECYWRDASKYNYFSTNFATYDNYNDFMLYQELILYTKTITDLVSIIHVKNMIGKDIKVMDCEHMYPDLSHAILFDTDGSLIICNKI